MTVHIIHIARYGITNRVALFFSQIVPNILANVKHLYSRQIRQKMIRLARRMTETGEALQMVTNAFEFPTNHREILTKIAIT